MRLGGKILIGCIAAPFVLVLFLLVLVLAFRAAPLPSPENVAVNQVDPIGGITPEMLAAEGLTIERASAARAVPVRISLEEGSFTIKPAPAGSSIKVEGNYDRGMYELKLEMSRDDEGNPAYDISFLPRYSMMRRILSQGFVHIETDERNALTIHIPRDLLIDLNARVAKGTSRLHLGGLALRNAELSLRMGEHQVLADEPNPVEMDWLVINTGMGEISLQNLGLLRAGTIEVAAGMGEVSVDLGHEIARDTALNARMRMGEMTVGLPRRARVDKNTVVWFGEARNDAPDPESEDPNAPLLTVHGSITMGEIGYERR